MLWFQVDGKHHEETLAMKIISVRRKESRELLILKKLNHVNIIKLRNISYDAYEIFSYRFFLNQNDLF